MCCAPDEIRNSAGLPTRDFRSAGAERHFARRAVFAEIVSLGKQSVCPLAAGGSSLIRCPSSIRARLHVRRSPFSPSRFIDSSMVSVSPDVDREGWGTVTNVGTLHQGMTCKITVVG